MQLCLEELYKLSRGFWYHVSNIQSCTSVIDKAVAIMPFSNLQGSNFKSCKLPFFLSHCRYLSDIIMSPQVFVKKMSLLNPPFISMINANLNIITWFPWYSVRGSGFRFPHSFVKATLDYMYQSTLFTNFVDRVPYFFKQNRALQFYVFHSWFEYTCMEIHEQSPLGSLYCIQNHVLSLSSWFVPGWH